LEDKKQTPESSLEYLKEAEVGEWGPVVQPEATASACFMAGEPVETFVGRERNLEELHQIITGRGAGNVTYVTGTDGIGKTEFVCMYAKRYEAEYPAGIFWASMRGNTWLEEAPKIFAMLYPEVEITPFPDNAKAKDEICRQLNRKEALLVIDNVNEADEIIIPDCSVLVTTKERRVFGITSRMAIKELDRLSEDDGVKLLVKVLGKIRVTLDPSGTSRIVEIFGGIPLALDIAAHHLEAVPDLSLSDYIGQIQRKIEELKLKDREDKYVAVSLELSLKQLEGVPHGAECITLFEAAGVCAESGFTSLTLAETAGLDGIDRGVLEELHRRSLLKFDRKSLRYSMHPLLRQLSEARLRMDESRELLYKENCCMHFLHFSQAHSNSPEVLVSERDGLWQAMIQTCQTGRADELLPGFLECLVQPFRQLTAGNDYEGAFRYLMMIGLINVNNLWLVNYLDAILQILVKNQAALQKSSQACVFTSLGSVNIYLGECRKAIDFFEKALEIHRQIGDLQGEKSDLKNIGSACADLGDYRRAIGFYEKQLEITRRTGDLRGEGNALGNIGIACADLGDYRRAIGFYEKQLEITRRIGDLRGEGNVFNSIGIAYAELGEYHRAVGFYEEAQEMYNKIREPRGAGNALANMGIAYAKMGAQEKAHKCFGASNVIFHGLGLKHVSAKIEEMMRDAEYWLLRKGVYVHERLTENKRDVFKKLQPSNKNMRKI